MSFQWRSCPETTEAQRPTQRPPARGSRGLCQLSECLHSPKPTHPENFLPSLLISSSLFLHYSFWRGRGGFLPNAFVLSTFALHPALLLYFFFHLFFCFLYLLGDFFKFIFGFFNCILKFQEFYMPTLAFITVIHLHLFW